jgi:hypothetical protein
MARKITAGVLLDLKDQLSPKIRGAGISVRGFAGYGCPQRRELGPLPAGS